MKAGSVIFGTHYALVYKHDQQTICVVL